MRAAVIEHGTRSAYVHLRCRCDRCREAEASYQRDYRAMNAERLRAYDRRPERDSRLRDDPAKRKVRGFAYDRLRRKKPRPACEVCGEPAEQHHDDYSRPLEVRLLCRRHHMQEHRKGVRAVSTADDRFTVGVVERKCLG